LVLTIITPVYNGSKYLNSCIQNVANQWVPGIEHLILDGGSQDGSKEILVEASEKFSHLRWTSEKDIGQSDAMNKGIKRAIGSWISFLNVDDFYEPHVLPKILQRIKNQQDWKGILVGNLKIWSEKGDLVSVNKPGLVSLPFMLADIGEWPFNPSAYFYPKEIHEKIGYFPVNEHFAMDYDFFFKVLLNKIPIKYCNENWGNFRLLPEAKTSKDQNQNNSYLRAMEIRKKYFLLAPGLIQLQARFLIFFWALRNKFYSILFK